MSTYVTNNNANIWSKLRARLAGKAQGESQEAAAPTTQVNERAEGRATRSGATYRMVKGAAHAA